MNPVRTNPITELLGIEHPIIQAPMAGVDTPALAAAVSGAGGLGSLACALLSPDQIVQSCALIREKTTGPFNLNFFCHHQGPDDPARQVRWKKHLLPYYDEFNVNPDHVGASVTRAPFDATFCAVVEDIKPAIVSFHFGLPDRVLLNRVKACGAIILSSATTVEEAIWLEANGCDVIIAQGIEAGGHRAMFLTQDLATQSGTRALVPQIVGAVSCPVVASGGIADARGIVAALSLGASAVQLGTAYLFTPEANVSPLYRQALHDVRDDGAVVTNVFSGRPARGIANRFIQDVGPISDEVPDFPYASHFVSPLRKASEHAGRTDCMQMWSGQAAHMCRDMTAADLTRRLMEDSAALMNGVAP
ncbi:NAD(P)H-dependent flavin oxidoreductase [Micavibrio aeruginosavorus]|uniref:NAD(P)H-dependent flavin oxidoreductase n=1 Tax=Micavibrio aeruginosavorus TaxID=349221 RepID=UPI003F4A8A19